MPCPSEYRVVKEGGSEDTEVTGTKVRTIDVGSALLAVEAVGDEVLSGPPVSKVASVETGSGFRI